MPRHVLVMMGLCATIAGCNADGDLPGSKAQADAWKPAWGDAAAAPVRPGSLIKTVSTDCTAGFLFVDPVTQAYYLSTAAHCADSADGTTYDGTGTKVSITTFGEIGTVVYDSDGPIPIPSDVIVTTQQLPPVDFALIRLNPDVNLHANPQMLSQEGPTGYVNCADMSPRDSIAIYGHGQIFEPGGVYARSGPLYQCVDSDGYEEFDALVPSFFGDSGGPVLHESSGKALALVTTIGERATTATAGLYGPTLQQVFRELAGTEFGSVSLATTDGGYAGP